MTNAERGPKVPKSIRFGEHGGRILQPHPGFAEVAERIGDGEFLMYRDLNDVFQRHDLKSGRISDLRFAVESRRLETATGVPIAAETYKGRTIYYNPTLDSEIRDQKLEEARQRIDAALVEDIFARGLVKQKTTGEN